MGLEDELAARRTFAQTRTAHRATTMTRKEKKLTRHNDRRSRAQEAVHHRGVGPATASTQHSLENAEPRDNATCLSLSAHKITLQIMVLCLTLPNEVAALLSLHWTSPTTVHSPSSTTGTRLPPQHPAALRVQTDSHVIVTVMIKGIPEDAYSVAFTDRHLDVSVRLSVGTEFKFVSSGLLA